MERWFIFLFIFVVTACSSPQYEPNAQINIEINRPKTIDLTHTEWNLIEWNGELPDPFMRDMTLSISDERLTGYSGCNHYTADYRLYDTTLSIPKSLFTWTLEACGVIEVDPETGEETRRNLNEIESEFYDQLRNRHQITLNAQVNPPLLTLTSDDTVFVFEKEQAPPLTETYWLFESMNSLYSPQPTAQSYLDDERYSFIRFLPDGTLDGQLICNDLVGSYEYNGVALTLDIRLGAERQPCEQAPKERDRIFVGQLTQVEGFMMNREYGNLYQLILLNEEGDTLFEFHFREKR